MIPLVFLLRRDSQSDHRGILFRLFVFFGIFFAAGIFFAGLCFDGLTS
jgi:hypothetical protein